MAAIFTVINNSMRFKARMGYIRFDVEHRAADKSQQNQRVKVRLGCQSKDFHAPPTMFLVVTS